MSLWQQLIQEREKTNLVFLGLLMMFFGSLLAVAGTFLFLPLYKEYSFLIYLISLLIVELGMFFFSLGILLPALLDKTMEKSVRVALISMATAILIMLLIIDIIFAPLSAITMSRGIIL